MKRILFAILLSLVVLPSLAATKGMKELIAWYSGAYTNEAQVKYDSTITKYRMDVVQIWNGKDEGVIWLFEQITLLDKPEVVVSQYFYKLSDLGKDRYEMEAFALNSELDPDACKRPDPLSGINPDELEPLGNCVMAGRRADKNRFNFGTPISKDCRLPGLKGYYHMLDINIFDDGRVNRKLEGFNEYNEKVFGVKDERGIAFRKITKK